MLCLRRIAVEEQALWESHESRTFLLSEAQAENKRVHRPSAIISLLVRNSQALLVPGQDRGQGNGSGVPRPAEGATSGVGGPQEDTPCHQLPSLRTQGCVGPLHGAPRKPVSRKVCWGLASSSGSCTGQGAARQRIPVLGAFVLQEITCSLL